VSTSESIFHDAPAVVFYSHLVTIVSLQASHAANLPHRVMRAGEAASHRVRANQQQEVVPADGGGPVGLVMRCAK